MGQGHHIYIYIYNKPLNESSNPDYVITCGLITCLFSSIHSYTDIIHVSRNYSLISACDLLQSPTFNVAKSEAQYITVHESESEWLSGLYNKKNSTTAAPAEMHHMEPKMHSSMRLTESSRNKCEHHKNVPNTVINYTADLKCATAAEFCSKVTISHESNQCE